ncbi:MAG TPA: tetratricopeptide repeat protein [Vicinamibacterales bacterium]|nr:tetratricopeptide repeat protein [Vicinamibacterales bacterium]
MRVVASAVVAFLIASQLPGKATGFSAVAFPTYSKDVAPLLTDRCAMCHHEGGSAPFSLTTFSETKRHAAQIAVVTGKRLMPPWKADPSDGPFVGQHPLSDAEIQLLQQWADGGTPEGDPRDLPPERVWTEGWQLGKPDLVVTLPQPYTLPPDGTDIFRIFAIPIPTDRVRFVRGLEFRPGNARVVHHANIRVDPTPASRRLDEADPAPGYDGVIARSANYPDGHFLGWTPGQVSPLLPDGLSWRLEQNTDLVVELHMQPSGKPEPVAPAVGLYFSETPPSRTPAMLRLGRQSIDIPAGDAHYTISDAFTLPVDAEIEAVQPHAHYRARDVRGFATLPDGSTKRLIDIADWDFRWQHVYRFVTPVKLPKGTTLSMRYVYDNSPSNVRNPQQPPARARWGQRSSDEMGDLWMQVLTRSDQDLETLSRAFRPKVAAEDVLGYEAEIEKHPDEADLHDSVAMLYLELGRYDQAIAHFTRTIALKPQSAQAHYNLGTGLTMARRLDEAGAAFRESLRLDPSYANAHNNLGNVLLAQGRNDAAIREFREVVRLQPQSAAALRNLAAAYAMDGQFPQAIDTIDRALQLAPSDPIAPELRRQRAMYLQRRADPPRP